MPDQLTGALTREDLVAALGGQTKTGLAIDLDGFIWVNDQFGFEAGDAGLVRVANALRAALRPRPIYRIAGEEFVALVEDGEALNLAAYVVSMVHDLELAYQRTDRPMPMVVEANVVVLAVSADVRAVERRAGDARYEWRRRERTRGFVVDAR